MGWLRNGTENTATTSRTNTSITVPTGTVTTDTGLIVIAGAATTTNETQTAPTLARTGGGGTFTLVAPASGAAAASNEFSWTFKATGLVGGDTVAVTLGGGISRIFDVFQPGYFDHDFGVIGTYNPRASSLATSTASAITVTAGTKVYALTSDRSASSTWVSTVNSNGDTITNRYQFKDSAGPVVSLRLDEFIEPTTSTGTTTTTYSTANSNGWGLHIAELASASAAASGTGSLTLTGSGNAAVPGAASGTGALTLTATAAAAATAAATGALTLTGAAAVGPPSLTRCMLGIPDTTAIRVTVLTVNTTTVRLAVSTSSGMTSPSYSGSTTPDAQGYCTNVTVTGLTAGGTYWYQIELNGTLVGSPVQAKTLPTAGTATSFSIGFGSCVKVDGGGRAGYASSLNPVSFASLAGRPSVTGRSGPEEFFHLGDIAYIWTNATSSVTPNDPVHIRASYEAGMDVNARALMAASPSAHTYSDNDSGGGNCDAGSGTWPALTSGTTMSVWKQVMAYPALPDSNAQYHAHQRGRVLLIVTDGRTYMDTATNTDNSSKSKLGATQRVWLLNLISTAKANGVGQIIWFHEDLWNDKGTTSAPGTTPQQDGWGAYNTERTTIGNAIIAAGVPVLYCCGDTHTLELDDGTNNSHGGFPVFCGAPFYQDAQYTTYSNTNGSYPTSGTGNLTSQQYYGWLDIVDNGTTITTTAKAWDATSSGGVYTSDVQRGTTMTLTATPSTAAAGTGSLTLTGTAGAAGRATGTATVTLTGAATGRATAAASGSITFASTGAGQTPAAGTGSIVLNGAGTLQPPAATGTGSIILAGTASSSSPAIGAGSVTLAGTGTTGAFSPASGTGSITFTSGASSTGTATATGAITFTSTANAAVRGAGTGSVILVGSGGTASPATGTAAITLVGAATAASGTIPASGTGSLTLTGTGTASGTGTATRDITITVTTGQPRITVTTGTG